MSTKIAWSEEVWNCTVGCSQVSDECQSCYAMGIAHRAMQPAHAGLTVMTEHGVDWTGEVRCIPERLDTPLSWRNPRRVFVDSMSDLFHPNVPTGFIADAFARMALTRRHTYQLLTKRPQRMAQLLAQDSFRVEVAEAATEVIGATPSYERWRIETPRDWTPVPDGMGSNVWHPPWPLPNLWAGASIGRDKFSFRADHVRATPAAVRWLSCEPLLEDLPSLDLTGIDWIVVGGESGPKARPMRAEWAADLRDRCADAGVAYFMKQAGAVLAKEWGMKGAGHEVEQMPPEFQIQEYPA